MFFFMGVELWECGISETVPQRGHPDNWKKVGEGGGWSDFFTAPLPMILHGIALMWSPHLNPDIISQGVLIVIYRNLTAPDQYALEEYLPNDQSKFVPRNFCHSFVHDRIVRN